MCEWNKIDGERRNVGKLQRDECHRSSQIDVHQSAKSLAHASVSKYQDKMKVHTLFRASKLNKG